MSDFLSLDQIDLPADLLREGTPDVSDLLATVSDPDIGILQPILVRPGDVAGRYFLVAGKRRYTAAKAAGLTQIPAHISELDNQRARIAELVENLARKDLAPHREAEGIIELIRLKFESAGMEVPGDEVKRILWRLGNEKKGIVEARMTTGVEGETVMAVFNQIGRSFTSFITGILPALSWPADVREAMEGGMSKASAQMTAQIKDDTMRSEAIKRIQEGEKARDVKTDILGAAAQHKQLTQDLTDAELIRNWKAEDGWLIPDMVLDMPEASGMDVLPRSELASEMLAVAEVPAGASVLMVMADVSDIVAALRYGVKVWTAHTQPRFDAEHDQTPQDADLHTVFINTKEGVYESLESGNVLSWAKEQDVNIMLLSGVNGFQQAQQPHRTLVGVTQTAGGNHADLLTLLTKSA